MISINRRNIYVYKSECGFQTRIMTQWVSGFVNVSGSTGKSVKPRVFLKGLFCASYCDECGRIKEHLTQL